MQSPPVADGGDLWVLGGLDRSVSAPPGPTPQGPIPSTTTATAPGWTTPAKTTATAVSCRVEGELLVVDLDGRRSDGAQAPAVMADPFAVVDQAIGELRWSQQLNSPPNPGRSRLSRTPSERRRGQRMANGDTRFDGAGVANAHAPLWTLAPGPRSCPIASHRRPGVQGHAE